MGTITIFVFVSLLLANVLFFSDTFLWFLWIVFKMTGQLIGLTSVGVTTDES